MHEKDIKYYPQYRANKTKAIVKKIACYFINSIENLLQFC